MRTIVGVVAAVLTLLTVIAVTDSSATADPVASTRSTDRVEQVPISFTVRNVNRSKVACASDGATYTVRGHLVAPSRALGASRMPSTTLYLHGLSFGEFFSNFQQSRDHNYAVEQAQRGNSSVVIDRLGYVSSDKPDGYQICVGSRADIAHQMVIALRTGRYELDGSAPPTFDKVVLAGHSYGGQIAQVAAYSFGDIDGLIVLGYSDRVQSARLKANAAYAAEVCARGGLRVGGTGPAGYAPFGPPSGASASLFVSAPGKVRAAALQLLTIDPCGDTASFAAAVAVDLANVENIRVPVLVISGERDALFPPPAGPDQASLFTGSRRVSQTTLRNTAHAFTFERGEDQFVRTVDHWLERTLR